MSAIEPETRGGACDDWYMARLGEELDYSTGPITGVGRVRLFSPGATHFATQETDDASDLARSG
jgi:hypothetical protein